MLAAPDLYKTEISYDICDICSKEICDRTKVTAQVKKGYLSKHSVHE